MEPLFLNLGIATDNDELSIIQGKYTGQYDLEFVTLCVAKDKVKEAYKQYLEACWLRYNKYADRGFLDKLRAREFHKRTWEMFLACLVMDSGYEIEDYRTKKNSAGPDIKVKHGVSPIWIEAIAPEENDETRIKWQLEDPELKMYGFGGDVEEIDKPRILKITAAIKEKYEKYNKYLKDEVMSSSDPYIIAINGGDFESWISDGKDVLGALFAVGLYTIEFDEKHEVKKRYNQRRSSVLNRNEKPINTEAFLSHNFEGVSAVIFSKDRVINSKSDGSDIMVLLNPYAKNPLPDDFPGFGKRFIYRDNKIIIS